MYSVYHLVGRIKTLFDHELIDSELSKAIYDFNIEIHPKNISENDVINIIRIANDYGDKECFRQNLNDSESMIKDILLMSKQLRFYLDKSKKDKVILQLFRQPEGDLKKQRKSMKEIFESIKIASDACDEVHEIYGQIEHSINKAKAKRKSKTSDYKIDFMIWVVISIYYSKFHKAPKVPALSSLYGTDGLGRNLEKTSDNKSYNLIKILFNKLGGGDDPDKDISGLIKKINKLRSKFNEIKKASNISK